VCEGAAIDMGLLVGALGTPCSRGVSVSFVGVSLVGEGAAIDIGLLPMGLLCCHFIVFERVGMASLGEGLGARSSVSVVGRARLGVEGALPLLIDPKPLNSGTSAEEFRWGGCSLCAMLAIEAEP